MADDDHQVRLDLAWAKPDLTVDVTPTILRAHRSRVRPARPSRTGRPKNQRGPGSFGTGAAPPTRQEDPELWRVHDELTRMDPTGARAGYALREALDQIYDGQRTGRWDYTQLSKTEKTHVGTLTQIWLQREFGFADGEELDFQIAGVDVDCKWSLNLYNWEIPLEMYTRGNKIALVVWANEYTARWAMGLVRISEDLLRPVGKQRDRKRRLNERGCDSIAWVVPGDELVRNTLLHIEDPAVLEAITYAPGGQTAINNLFRYLTGQLINRATVLTAAQQVDSAKRVRDARKHLRNYGIVIFGHYQPHPDMAETLGLPRPTLGRYVSTTLARWTTDDPEPFILIGDTRWRRGRPDETLTDAPSLPEQTRSPR